LETTHPPQKRQGLSLLRLAGDLRRVAMPFCVGLIVLMLIQIPAVEESFLGAPDREMTETAFKLRSDLIGGVAEPVLFFDIDDRTLAQLSPSPFAMPLDTTPRGVVASLLDFIRTTPPALAPRVVVLDVDIAQPASDGPDGIAHLQAALTAWAASPNAPALIISRQTFPGSLFKQGSTGAVLPDSAYDAIVQPAPNIFWATPKVLGDQNGVIREFMPYECVHTRSGVQPLYSAALLAYQYAERDPKVLAKAGAKHWVEEAAARCQHLPDTPLSRGERVDYHFSLDLGFRGRVWPNLSPAWPGFKQCSDGDRTIFRRLSVIDIVDALNAGGDISHDLLCQRVVMIGGTNSSAGDFVQTPLNEMNGSAVLANAVRGLQLTHGGLRQIPLILQVLLLGLASAAMSATALATGHARRHYRRLKRNPHKANFNRRAGIILLNPIVVNGIIAFAAHGIGIGLLLVSLNYGLWGFLSAPVFAAAITETVQEFADG
jgi:CHASE2 domain-containing sensor protein